MHKIGVQAQNGAYDVIIQPGILDEAGNIISVIMKSRKALLVTDDTVASLWLEKTLHALDAAGFSVSVFTFPHGEEHKTLDTVRDILEYAVSAGLERSDFIIALGGGVCGDMAGFASSMYMRGIPFVQIPTTLLASVDASVGGKTGVNLGSGKNQIGTFHQPSCVIFDPDVLSTLPAEQMDDGKAEIIKHSVLAGGRLYHIIQEGTLMENIEEAVALNVEIKKSYVVSDPFDKGYRQMLNFGHTIGHAIEKCSNYKISHGHAVAMGMVAETQAFLKLYNEKSDVLDIIKSILEKNNIKYKVPYSAQELITSAMHDKKMLYGKLSIIAPEGIGKCTLRTLESSRIPEYIAAGL